MTVRDLKIFLSVCENLSMSTTAANLSISQSAVSQTIKELEQHYNVKLFKRTRNGLTITDSGRTLISCSHHIISYYSHIENVMRSNKAKPSIHIGGLGVHLLLDLVAEYGKIDDSVDLIMHTSSQSEIVQKLISGVIDVAVLDCSPDSINVDVTPICSLETILICKPDSEIHPALKADNPELEMWELSGLPILMRDLSCNSSFKFDQIMRANNIDYFFKGEFTSFNSVYHAVEMDLGLGLVIDRTSDYFAGRFKRVRVKNLELYNDVYFAYHSKNRPPEYMAKFIDFAKNNLGSTYISRLNPAYI